MSQQKDGDYFFKLQFERSFHGKAAVDKLFEDNYKIRDDMIKHLGAKRMSTGMSKNNELLWYHKGDTYSRLFLKRFPKLDQDD